MDATTQRQAQEREETSNEVVISLMAREIANVMIYPYPERRKCVEHWIDRRINRMNKDCKEHANLSVVVTETIDKSKDNENNYRNPAR